jgi:uncharacterized membrane protein YeaQ/YmgE (transglycosylase-associated protein family)
MSLLGFLILLLIAAVCGAVAGALGGSRGGFFVSLVVGFVGAFVGMWLATALGLPAVFVVQVEGAAFPVFWSIVGGALFVALLTLLSGRRPPP